MEYFIELLKYIILGIIQGITEIFPVSSSGHLVIFSKLFMGGQDLENELTLFLMITNMGSFLALVVFYFKEIKSLVSDTWSFVFNPLTRNNRETRSSFYYALKLCIAVIPLGIMGLLFKDVLPTNLLSVGISLIVTSLLLFTVFMFRNVEFTEELTFKNAAMIGLFQAFAVFPGLSRSGITMVGGLSQRVRLQYVLKFS
ncbi:MAG TPA: undecaprenyl-diphosphate phosphatase, partial [Acholeplasma sp.]|nr:undecaprenyl-diphosphate phosphatase [Acholeplasma sp.]